MGGLANSRHAPVAIYQTVSASASSHDIQRTYTPPQRPQSTPLATITPALAGRRDDNGHDGLASPTLELVRFTKIVRRLKWKLPFLGEGYGRAVDRVGQDSARVAEAELMFKLDFFEFYALIERALVHLMGVFGIHISARAQRRLGLPGMSQDPGPSGSPMEAQHSYHANVLDALDSKENPLHFVLGTGEVRKQLGRAKELRNRWKTAADDHDDGPDKTYQGAGENRWRTKKIAAPLESYNLEGILSTVFAGFVEAFLLAQRFIQSGGVLADTDGNIITNRKGEDIDMVDWSIAAAAAAGEGPDDDEMQWNFMTDAMDWEAV